MQGRRKILFWGYSHRSLSKKEQEKERCTGVRSKGKASPAGAFLSRHIRPPCFPAPHSPPTWTSPSSKAILGSILLAHLPHKGLNLYPCLPHGCTLASVRRSPGLFTSPCSPLLHPVITGTLEISSLQSLCTSLLTFVNFFFF